MEFELNGANIVLLAEKHNISIVSKEWASQNDLINEKVVNFAHLPVASVIETDNFSLFVDEKNLRISLKIINDNNLNILPEMVVRYINKLPEIPYRAIGLNFLYSVEENQEELKKIFTINDEKLKNVFSGDYLFGGILKFDSKDFNITLTVQPKNSEETNYDFNFHYPSSNKDEIIEILKKYFETVDKAKMILGELLNE